MRHGDNLSRYVYDQSYFFKYLEKDCEFQDYVYTDYLYIMSA